jgi:hypothetical protein
MTRTVQTFSHQAYLHPCWVYKLSWASHFYLLHITRTPLV